MSRHQCCKLSMKDPERGVHNEIFAIYNLAEKTLFLELRPYLKHMKQDTRPFFFKFSFLFLINDLEKEETN